ncbi:MAG: hypothetical protein QNJ91_08210 [Gammaproteobacteria bacterium]|nr:hypothetical protein [Gammaproteobacteria bacterium]
MALFMAGTALSLLTACQTTPWRGGDGQLPRDEVVRLFVGNTVESFNLNTRLTSFTYYDPNGTALQERLWQRRKGTWRVRDDGQICLAFGKRQAKCRHIVRSGGRYFKERTDSAGKRERIVRYRYFVAGNSLNAK